MHIYGILGDVLIHITQYVMSTQGKHAQLFKHLTFVTLNFFFIASHLVCLFQNARASFYLTEYSLIHLFLLSSPLWSLNNHHFTLDFCMNVLERTLESIHQVTCCSVPSLFCSTWHQFNSTQFTSLYGQNFILLYR